MAIKCEVCGGVLQMDTDGANATCKDCGMTYPITRVKKMLEQGKTPAPPNVKQEPSPPTPVRPEPVKQDTPAETGRRQVVMAQWEEAEEEGEETVVIPKTAPAKNKPKGKASDYIIPIVLCLLGISMSRNGGFFPMLLGMLMCIAGGLLAIGNVRKNKDKNNDNNRRKHK